MSDDKTCTKKSCVSGGCIFQCLTLLANLALIVVLLFLYSKSYGQDAKMILLLLLPPVMAVIALSKGADKEERNLRKRIRKANLRKELDGLSAFDKTE